MNELLLTLRVLSKLQANERLGPRVDGVLTIGRSNQLLSRVGRYLRGESRTSSMREVERVIGHAREKANDLMNSRFLDEGGSCAQGVRVQLAMLGDNLGASVGGLRALQQTYSEDSNVVACLDQIIANIDEVVAEIKAAIGR